jgi:hypothetical protein
MISPSHFRRSLAFPEFFMVRWFAVAAILSYLAAPAWTQAQPAPGTAGTQTGTAAVKSVVKKQTPKSKTVAKPPAPDDGRCDLGVISAAGTPIGLRKVGLMVFGNEYSEVPSDAWGIDDLIVAPVRAAAGSGIEVRRIAVTKEALFELYEKPGKGLFNNPRENLTAAVRQIAANSHCGRYIVVARFAGNLSGTNQSLKGIGVLTGGPFGKAAVFAYIQVTVFDGQTFAIRDDPFGSFGARLSSSLSQFAKDEYMRTVEGAEFPASPEAAAKDAKLRDGARALLTERLDRILPEYLKE